MSKAEDLTKEQLIEEIEGLRRRVAELEKSEDKRKWAEEALYESEFRYRTLFNNVSLGVVVATYDGRILAQNNAILKMTGYSEVEIKQINIRDTYKNPEERVLPLRHLQKEGFIHNFEVALKRKNGTLYYANLSIIPFTLDNKDVLLTLAEDITERKHMEDEFRRANAEYMATINMTDDIIIRLDKDNRGILVNDGACQFFGLSREELVNSKFGDHVYSDDVVSSLQAIENMIKTSKHIYGFVNRQITPFGTKIVEWNFYPFFDGNGQFDGWQATGRDITERKRIEEEIVKTRAKVEALRVSGKMKTQLLSLVSHELRTPLASIQGFANTLLQSDVEWTKEEEREFIQEIERATDRLTRIVGDLLDMTYLEAGVLSLNRGTYKLHKVLESASDILTKITEHHQLQVKVPEELPLVFADQERVIQVLTNLVENAVKFSKESSQITVEASLDSDAIIVAVTDEGIGIPSELVDKVFDRFYQAKAIVTGHKSGTGLGLSICRGIVAAHGGRIWVKSKAGKGSKFSFSLPVSKKRGYLNPGLPFNNE